MQVIASAITLLNAVSAGTTFGYQTTAAVTYPVPNATALVEPMNESQLSWFSECSLSLDAIFESSKLDDFEVHEPAQILMKERVIYAAIIKRRERTFSNRISSHFSEYHRHRNDCQRTDQRFGI